MRSLPPCLPPGHPWTAAAAALWLASCLSAPGEATYVEGEVLVELRAATNPGLRAGHTFGTGTVHKKFKHLSRRKGRSMLHLRDHSRSTKALLAELANHPDVLAACPNYLRFPNPAKTTDDPDFDLQWALHNTGQPVAGISGTADADISWPESRVLSTDNNPEVVIAVIDTGVDIQHADLANRIWINPGEVPDNGIDDDANGYIDDIHGYDFSGDLYTNSSGVPTNDGPDNDPSDIEEHGTHVAGIAAAETGNGLGIAGVSRAKIMALKAGSSGISLTSADIISALEYAADMADRGVNIAAVNASFGGGGFSTFESAAIEELEDREIVFCAAAGNVSVNNDAVPNYPSGYTTPQNIVSVAATDSNDALASFSNFGATSVDLAAPGDRIHSARPSCLDATASVLLGAVSHPANAFSFTGMTSGLSRPYHACGIGDLGDFPPAVSGNIALIERGTIYFYEKVRNAMDAGALGVIMYNKAGSDEGDDGLNLGTLGRPNQWIPAVNVSRNSGLALLGSTGATITITAETDPATGYQMLGGTSMATPVVAGAIALLAEHYPADTAAQRIQRLYAAADPVPALSGLVATGRRLNLERLLDTDADQLPDWFETPLGTLAAIDATTDSDRDGSTDLWEFRAGTDAQDPASRLRITAASHHPAHGFMLRWPSAPGRQYDIQSTVSLEHPFTLLQGGLPATAPENTRQIPVSEADPSRFYRVRLLWP